MNWRGTKVVVTGGAGFLGSHLCEALVARGAYVTVLDDFSTGTQQNLQAISKDVKIFHCHLGSFVGVPDGTIRGDILFHLAAMADPRKCKEDFDLAFQTNVLGLKAMLAGWKNYGRVIYLSSAAVYGDPDYVPIDENHPLKGRDPYAITKVLGEWICRHYMENVGVPVTVIRNFNTFGPRQSPSYLIPTLIRQALVDKKIEVWNADPVRDFIYISDAVDALLAVAAAENTIGLTINSGSGHGVRVGDLVEKMAHLFGVPVVNLQREVIGSKELVCDNTKLRVLTGWAPKITLEDGLKETINAFQQLAQIGGGASG